MERVASLAGLPHAAAAIPAEVASAAAEPGLVVVRTDRADNVALHREVVDRVAAVIA
jgi:hypothetical protein